MKLFLLFLLTVSLYSDNIELNLKQFAELVSSQHKVNIIINDDIEKDKFSFFIQRNKNTILLGAFKKMLELKKLRLIYDKKYSFYYIDKIALVKPPILKLRTIKLDTLVFDDIKLILEQFRDLKYSYIKNTNTIMIISTNKDYKDLNKVISDNDNRQEQFRLKITVIETNLNESEERGVQINSYVKNSPDSSTEFFINLITMPSTAVTNVFNSSFGFTASLNFLDGLGVTKIKSSPTMTVQSGKKIYFSSVQNIPYLSSSSSVNGASQSKSETITYKDVGLKIDMLPTLINGYVYIDLDFSIESILDKSSLTPIISKRQIKNSFQLKKGQLLVLSGLNQEEVSNTSIGVPILMKLPYIGNIFKYDYKTSVSKSLSIMIEII